MGLWWVFMGFHGFSWVSDGFSWVSDGSQMGFHGFWWVSDGSLMGLRWVLMGLWWVSDGSSWVFMGLWWVSDGFSWVLMKSQIFHRHVKKWITRISRLLKTCLAIDVVEGWSFTEKIECGWIFFPSGLVVPIIAPVIFPILFRFFFLNVETFFWQLINAAAVVLSLIALGRKATAATTRPPSPHPPTAPTGVTSAALSSMPPGSPPPSTPARPTWRTIKCA